MNAFKKNERDLSFMGNFNLQYPKWRVKLTSITFIYCNNLLFLFAVFSTNWAMKWEKSLVKSFLIVFIKEKKSEGSHWLR